MIKFKTVAGHDYEIEIDENLFFEYMKHCGVANIHRFNQLALYINNIHEKHFLIPYDSVLPQTIEYQISRGFRKKYAYINDSLLFDL